METDHAAYQTAAQLKARARKGLLGRLNTTIGATVLFLLIYLLVFSIVTPQADSLPGLIWLQIATIIIRILSGIFVSGSAYLYLNLIYEKDVRISDLFHAFREEPYKAVLLQFVFVIAALIANLPLFLYEWSAGDSYQISTELLFTLLVPVLTFVLTLPFSQVYYLLQDFPERDILSLLRASARLMQGQKRRFTLLVLSFLPLLLVCVLTLFLPMLWLYSYYKATLAAFYRDLIEGGGHGSA